MDIDCVAIKLMRARRILHAWRKEWPVRGGFSTRLGRRSWREPVDGGGATERAAPGRTRARVSRGARRLSARARAETMTVADSNVDICRPCRRKAGDGLTVELPAPDRAVLVRIQVPRTSSAFRQWGAAGTERPRRGARAFNRTSAVRASARAVEVRGRHRRKRRHGTGSLRRGSWLEPALSARGEGSSAPFLPSTGRACPPGYADGISGPCPGCGS